VLGPPFGCAAMCWGRYLSVDQCVGVENRGWDFGFGPIVECGAVCLDRKLSMERFVGTEI